MNPKILIIATLLSSQISAQTAKEPLWPDGAPHQKGNAPHKDIPVISIYQPESGKRNGTALVICPGGGYGGLATGHEGQAIGEWMASLGVTGVVLEYRMSRGGYRHPVPLLDAQRAIRTVRHRAKDLQVDPTRIGILGFSAGGHLASTAGTHFDAGNPDAKDPVDRESCRPDYMVLCYPVIAFDEPFTHRGSQNNLLGKEAPKELVDSLSNEKQVTKDTPPTFLFHTDEDTGVPPENSVAFYLALRRAKVPAEMHIFRKGGHGLGMAQNIPGTGEWPRMCELWMQNQGLLPH
jgi:acetyl esterase/lipase